MNFNRLAIISIIVTAIFVMPVFSFAEDGSGVPFQALQEQIDNLQDQIDELQIQTGTVKAYTNSSHLNSFPQDEEWNIIDLSLPEGKFIMTIAINATFWHGGSYDPDYHTFLDCKCVDEGGFLIPGCGAGGGVAGHDSLVQTIPLSLNDATKITLRCSHSCGYDDPLPNDPMSMGIVWTAIEVNEIDNQFTP